MSLTLRLVKGDTLTFEELDNNFIFLSDSRLETDLSNLLATTTSIGDGQTIAIKTIDGNGNEAAFFDYVIKNGSGSNKRAGGAIIMWKVSDGLAEFTEYSTLDIGNTSNITIGVTLVSSTVYVNVTNNSGEAITVKSVVRLF